MDNPAVEVAAEAGRKPAVNCPRCRRLFNVPSGKGEGDVIACPFCYASMMLRTRVILVAEAVEPA